MGTPAYKTIGIRVDRTNLSDSSPVYAVLRALVVNDFISGHSRRRYISKNLEIDGENDNPLACISYGPRGEQAYEAAWMTAELQLVKPEDVEHQMPLPRVWRDTVDKGALALYAKHAGE